MGLITYDGLTIQVDDRTLAHLQIVIVNKLRRGESFLMSWRIATDVGSGRGSIWLHPLVLLHFKFDGNRVPAINDHWIADLAASADSSRGLVITRENGELEHVVEAKKRASETTVVAPASDPSEVMA